ncbi:MAG: hypothetical protein HY553_17790 [Elusimicrobia bacterium]|nr:hypothetical protein [Elusimicrobiota bacterium]
MPGDKARALRASLWGPRPDRAIQNLRTGAELERALEERRRRPPLRTGLGALDRMSDGGLARGALVELCGRRSSGRLALALAALAAATSAGEPTALVDPAEQLDPESARAAGVELKRLLWVRPGDARASLACCGALVDAGFALVVLDVSELRGKRKRVPAAAWLRLARAARAQEAVLLLVSAEPLAGTAADALLTAEKARTLWDRGAWPPLLSGVASRLSVCQRRRLGVATSMDTLSLSSK